MIKVFEIILCMYLKTISPDVPRCGRSLHLYVLFITDNIKKKIGQAILVGKCCHCRIELSSILLSQCSLNMLDKRNCIWSKLPYMRKTSVPHLLVIDGHLWRMNLINSLYHYMTSTKYVLT